MVQVTEELPEYFVLRDRRRLMYYDGHGTLCSWPNEAYPFAPSDLSDGLVKNYIELWALEPNDLELVSVQINLEVIRGHTWFTD